MDEELVIKQNILSIIVEKKKTNVKELSSFLNLSREVCYSYSKEIHYEGYIDFTYATDSSGKDALLNLNGKGEIFFNNGGYEKEKKEYNKQKRSQQRQKILSSSSLWVSIVTSIIALVFAYLTFSQMNEIKKLKEQLESNILIKTKKELVGKWCSTSKVNYAFYEFFENNEWQFQIQSKNKLFIRKGEYQIGKDNGIFLRRFGLQHWFHDTTFVDIKSGIGASYLYLKNDKLINNQEDYESEYKKEK